MGRRKAKKNNSGKLTTERLILAAAILDVISALLILANTLIMLIR